MSNRTNRTDDTVDKHIVSVWDRTERTCTLQSARRILQLPPDTSLPSAGQMMGRRRCSQDARFYCLPSIIGRICHIFDLERLCRTLLIVRCCSCPPPRTGTRPGLCAWVFAENLTDKQTNNPSCPLTAPFQGSLHRSQTGCG